MNVSRRHITLALSALAGTLVLTAGSAMAGGGGNGGPCCGQPPSTNVTVPTINVPGPNVSVGTPNVSVGGGSYSVGGTSFRGSQGIVIGSQSEGGYAYYGGGGSYFSSSGVEASMVEGLNVEGGEQTVTQRVIEQVPFTEASCVETVSRAAAIRPVQAVCMDDTGTPHPASRPDDTVEVDPKFRGEIFRCMAGTSMQVTVGELVGGKASFDRAESFSCEKGEALVHGPGGTLACKPQIPQRNCNERSLLRRYGPGLKLVTMTGARRACEPVTRTVLKPVEREVTRQVPNAASPIVFDGGVGQGVF